MEEIFAKTKRRADKQQPNDASNASDAKTTSQSLSRPLKTIKVPEAFPQ